MTDKISIRFFDGHGEFAARYWTHVPRAGDEVMLGSGKRYLNLADSAGKVAFTVKRVVWGVEGPNDRSLCVNIEIVLAPLASKEANHVTE